MGTFFLNGSIYLSMAALGLVAVPGLSLIADSEGCSLVVVHLASLAVEHVL